MGSKSHAKRGGEGSAEGGLGVRCGRMNRVRDQDGDQWRQDADEAEVADGGHGDEEDETNRVRWMT